MVPLGPCETEVESGGALWLMLLSSELEKQPSTAQSIARSVTSNSSCGQPLAPGKEQANAVQGPDPSQGHRALRRWREEDTDSTVSQSHTQAN